MFETKKRETSAVRKTHFLTWREPMMKLLMQQLIKLLHFSQWEWKLSDYTADYSKQLILSWNVLMKEGGKV
jgi:hypothetical protein